MKAQNNLDSLWLIWRDMERADSTRFEAMYEICESRARSVPDSVFNWANELHKQAREKGSLKYQAGALLQLGRAYSYKGDFPNTAIAYDQSLALYEDVGYKFGVGRVLAYMAGNLANQGDYQAAIKKGEQTMAIAREIDDKKLSSGVAKVLGHSYGSLGNTVKAIEVYEKGRREAEIIDDKEVLAWHIHAIADVYSSLGEEEKALEFHRRSLSIYEEIDDKLGIAGIIGHQAARSLEKGNFQTALEEYKRAERIYEKMGAKSAHVDILHGLAEVYRHKGDYEQAKIQINKAEAIVNKMGYTVSKAELFIFKGQLDQLQGYHTRAIQWCTDAFEMAGKLKALNLQRDACNCLYNAYKAIGQGNKALVYLEKLNALTDSLNLEETAKELQQMEFQKQMLTDSLAKAEEARLIEEAHKEEVREKNNTRNVLIGSFLLMLVLAGGIYSRLRFVRKSRAQITKEKDRSESLLLNILPEEIARELKEKGRAEARDYDMVSILFTDFKGFTEQSAKLSAADLVSEINHCFEAFDGIIEKYDVEKIKTIGDAYMAAGGLPVPKEDSVKNTVLAALEMQEFIEERKKIKEARGELAFSMRAGIHTGPVVAGIVGVKKFQYDIWGDTVNTASRMESSGEVGKVNISQDTYKLLKDDPQFAFESRGKIEAKGKGEMEMYFVSKN